MTTHFVTPAQLGAALRREAKKVPALLERAALRAAHRGKARLVAATDEKGITDMGQYKNSFKVEKGPSGEPAVLFNDAPMAGVIELGARPHPVSQAGIEAIAAWVLRNLSISVSGPIQRGSGGRKKFTASVEEQAAMGIALAIARKIRAKGQKPRHVFADELPTLRRYLKEEMERALRGNVGRGWRKGMGK